MPCIGVAEALSHNITTLHIRPRALWSAFAPWFCADKRDLAILHHALNTHIPDIVIASGRRTVPLLRWLKRRHPQIFTVFLKNPRTRFSGADLIWAPSHDSLHGTNIITSLTSPHRISARKLADARHHRDPRFGHDTQLCVAVLLGGNSRHHTFTLEDQRRLVASLKQLTQQGACVLVTPSRRTPAALAQAVKDLCTHTQGFYWDSTGENPYINLLAHADYVVVTADSTNMVGEAAATGKPILVFEPSGGHAKITRFLQAMYHAGYAHPFTGTFTGAAYSPIDSTLMIAEAIVSKTQR